MITAGQLVVTEFVILSVACVLLVRYYKSNLVPKDVSIVVYVTCVLGFAGILFLPYDLSIALVEHQTSTGLSIVWNLIYWVTFFLAWAVLPVLTEFHSSGNFTASSKLRDAVFRQALALLIGGGIAIVYIIYQVSIGKGSFSQVLGFMMAMGNTYGVILISLLLGHGLVAVPQRLWMMADTESELQNLYISAPGIEQSYQESRYELEDCESEVAKAVELLERSGIGSELRLQVGEYIDKLKNDVSSFKFESRSTSRSHTSHNFDGEEIVRKSSLVRLNARLKQAQLKARACERRWKVLLINCRDFEIQLNDPSTSLDLENSWCAMQTSSAADNTEAGGSGSPAGTRSPVAVLTDLVSVHNPSRSNFSKKILRGTAIVLASLSAIVLWSEMMMASSFHSPMGYMMSAYSPDKGSAIIVQGVSFLFITYMSICTYSTLFNLNIGMEYRLEGNQQSHPAALIFNAQYFARLQFSLGYNFLLAVNVPHTKPTAFSSLMDNMQVVPIFGAQFTVYVPIIMIIVAGITLMNGFERFLKLLHMEAAEESGSFQLSYWKQRTMSASDAGKLEEGKGLVQAAMRTMNRDRGSGNSCNDSAKQKRNNTPMSKQIEDSLRKDREERKSAILQNVRANMGTEKVGSKDINLDIGSLTGRPNPFSFTRSGQATAYSKVSGASDTNNPLHNDEFEFSAGTEENNEDIDIEETVGGNVAMTQISSSVKSKNASSGDGGTATTAAATTTTTSSWYSDDEEDNDRGGGRYD